LIYWTKFPFGKYHFNHNAGKFTANAVPLFPKWMWLSGYKYESSMCTSSSKLSLTHLDKRSNLA
jgi:hypothetical protein